MQEGLPQLLKVLRGPEPLVEFPQVEHQRGGGIHHGEVRQLALDVARGPGRQKRLVDVGISQEGIGLAQFPERGRPVGQAQEVEAVGGHLPPEFNCGGGHELAPGLDLPVHLRERRHQAPAFDVEVAGLPVPAAGRVIQASPGYFKAHKAGSNLPWWNTSSITGQPWGLWSRTSIKKQALS